MSKFLRKNKYPWLLSNQPNITTQPGEAVDKAIGMKATLISYSQMDIWKPSRYCPMDPCGQLNISSLMQLYYLPMILAEILQPVEVGSLSHYLQGFNKKKCCTSNRWWKNRILPSKASPGCLWRTATFHWNPPETGCWWKQCGPVSPEIRERLHPVEF